MWSLGICRGGLPLVGARALFGAILACLAGVCLGGPAMAQAGLTATEQRWLSGAAPVLAYARRARLPLDVVVQPQPAAGLSPLGLAFVEGRCKLVLSMRGNPEAEAVLERLPPGAADAALELMAAHELGHCRRYLDGAWMQAPAGFSAAVPAGLQPELRSAYLQMRATRHEEAYGDLVGLAWIRQQRPSHYAAMLGWLTEERLRDRMPGSHHDTLPWLLLAAEGSQLDGATLFSGVDAVWARGAGQAE